MHIGEGILTATRAGQGRSVGRNRRCRGRHDDRPAAVGRRADPQGGRAGVGLLRRLGHPGADGLFVGPPCAQRPDGPGARLGHFSDRARRPDSAIRVLFHWRSDRAGNQHADHGPAGRDLPLPFPLDRLQRSSVGWSLRAGSPPGRSHSSWAPCCRLRLWCWRASLLSCWPRDFSRSMCRSRWIEGLVTGSVVVLLRQVRPEVLRATMLVPMAQEVGDG